MSSCSEGLYSKGRYLLPLGAGAHGAIEREAAWDQPVRVVADLVRGRVLGLGLG